MSILTATNPQVLHRELPSQKHHQQQQQQKFLQQNPPLPGCFWSKKGSKRQVRAASFWDFGRPTSVEMVPIEDNDQLDRILLQAQERSVPILIDWMAAWCRKCIYLKPKLERLAAEFDTKLQVYCVDVNKVPQSLVKRGNVSKMPTIQIWKDGEFKEEVIGGHQAWLVVDEVRAMIKKFV